LGHGRVAVRGLADHRNAVGGLEDDAKARADKFLVIDDQHPDAHRAGSRAETANPSAWVGPTVRLPPQDATRSAIPARPSPDPLAWSRSGLPVPCSVTRTVTWPGS